MGVAENMALARRVTLLEGQILAVEPVRIRTMFHVHRRGAEPVCRTVADVEARRDLAPVTELVRVIHDLDVVIDAEQGVHLPHFDGRDPDWGTYEEIAGSCRVLDVVISCYEDQLEQITSEAGITASVGGARAGKTRILVWWLFRQWLLRGHGLDEDHEREAVFWWIREDGEKLYTHGVRWIEALWPPEVFVGARPGEKTKNPVHKLIDGSTIAYRHAHHSGKRAGTNLRSESVAAIVVDEVSAILHPENWNELVNRVGQTGGPIACAYTPTAGHWVEEMIEKRALGSGGAIVLRRLSMFSNPWWPLAKIWWQFLRLGGITSEQLEEGILAKRDQIAASFDVVTNPDARRMFFGESSPVGLVLWREWSEDYISEDYDAGRDQLRVGGRWLDNITEHVLGDFFQARGFREAGGKDFNVNPQCCVIFRLFGNPAAPHVVVLREVGTTGTTYSHALEVAKRHPGLVMHCDPTGAMSWRHEGQGDKSRTNAESMRALGLECEPANGYHGNKVAHLPQMDSIDAMHRAMAMGLLRVHPRCHNVIKAMTDMRSTARGTIKKKSGADSLSDQISGWGDALRYGVWPFWQNLVLPGGVTHDH
jgi:hypothetical protein